MAARIAGLDLFVLDAPHLFDRPGNPYSGPDGHDWPTMRFALARSHGWRRASAWAKYQVLSGYRARA